MLMISPDLFYERELKGKSSSQILSKIRGLKNVIGELKNIIEKPLSFYNIDNNSIHAELTFYKMYLEKAKEALHEVGVEYQPSKAEKRALKIDERISYLSELVYSIGGFFEGYTTFTIRFCEEYMEVKKEVSYDENSVEVKKVSYPKSKEAFLNELRDIHFGEWKSRYDDFNVLDGTQWILKMYFSKNYRKLSFSGSNSYPYNFNEFCDLIIKNISEK